MTNKDQTVKPARHAASRRVCYKQIRWTLTVINLWPKCYKLVIELSCFVSKVANMQVLHLHLT